MLRIFPLKLLVLFVLCGCVSDNAETALSDKSEPLGVPKIEGETPNIGETPLGQTTQMSEDEKASLKQDLDGATQKANAQAARDVNTDYRSEAEAMRKLAEDERKKRIEQIESRKF